MKSRLMLVLKSAVFCSFIALFMSCNTGVGKSVENNLTFSILSVDKSYPVENTDPDQGYSLKLQFAYPVSSDAEMAIALQKQFITSFLGSNYNLLTPENAVEQYMKDYFDRCKKEEKEYLAEIEKYGMYLDEHSGYTQNRSIHNDIIYNRDGLLSYVVHTEYYAGGAHGQHSVENHVLDIKTRQPVSEKEIFVDEYKDALSRLIVDEIVKTNQVKDAGALETIGFFDANEIAPNGNFCIDSAGLTYTFNEYEIAAYAVGAVDVQIPYEKIRHILRREGPVFVLVFR